MTSLHGVANLAYTRAPLPALGRLHPEARSLRPLPSRVVAIRPVRLGRGQAPGVYRRGNRLLRLGGPDDQRPQGVWGLQIHRCAHFPARDAEEA
jgi:hypothetical protein